MRRASVLVLFVASVLVAAGLTWCLEDPERSKAEGYELADVQKMFTKLA